MRESNTTCKRIVQCTFVPSDRSPDCGGTGLSGSDSEGVECSTTQSQIRFILQKQKQIIMIPRMPIGISVSSHHCTKVRFIPNVFEASRHRHANWHSWYFCYGSLLPMLL